MFPLKTLIALALAIGSTTLAHQASAAAVPGEDVVDQLFARDDSVYTSTVTTTTTITPGTTRPATVTSVSSATPTLVDNLPDISAAFTTSNGNSDIVLTSKPCANTMLNFKVVGQKSKMKSLTLIQDGGETITIAYDTAGNSVDDLPCRDGSCFNTFQVGVPTLDYDGKGDEYYIKVNLKGAKDKSSNHFNVSKCYTTTV